MFSSSLPSFLEIVRSLFTMLSLVQWYQLIDCGKINCRTTLWWGGHVSPRVLTIHIGVATNRLHCSVHKQYMCDP